jgi:hypothetical protein
MPALGPGSQGWGVRGLFAVAGVAVAIGASVALVASWPSGGNDTPSISQTVSLPRAGGATAAPQKAGAAGAPQGAVRIRSCGPIFRGGTPYPVTSTASRGAPAGCGEAHSVLLQALNGGSADVGDWSCARSPGARRLEVCSSASGRRITARD